MDLYDIQRKEADNNNNHKIIKMARTSLWLNGKAFALKAADRGVAPRFLQCSDWKIYILVLILTGVLCYTVSARTVRYGVSIL